MDIEAIHTLRKLNNDFYRANSASFSRSRHSPWKGWDRVASSLASVFEPDEPCAGQDAYRVLDVACGNLRFERFLLQRFSAARIDFTCVDSCVDMADAHEGVTFVERDAILDLAEGALQAGGGKPSFDVAVSFGFMHHIPTQRLRELFMHELLRLVRSGGVVALSFWRFMSDEKLAEKALRATAEGLEEVGVSLEEGDYLLGWNEEAKTYRYCHSFSDGEVDELLQSVGSECELIDRFRADGRSDALNGYVVIRRR